MKTYECYECYENFAMETFYSTKNDFSNFGYCNREWLCAAVF